MRRSAYLWGVALVLIVASMVDAGQPALEGYSDYRAFRGKARALARSKFVSYEPLARTLGGRDMALLTVGTGRVDEKPAVLVVGGVDPARLVDGEVVLRVAERLSESAETDQEVRGLLDRVTFYFIAQAAPDGREAFFERPLAERSVNHRPTDDDTDGQADEDGPDDLNGDGLISVMRVVDAEGEYIVHPDDDHVMIEADAQKGELGRYKLYEEGRDNDGDGELNEDPPGGVAFDHNFPFQYPYFQQGAGPHQVSEIETKAVADFAYDHPNIALVWTLSERDNLLEKWKPDEAAEEERIKTTLMSADAPYFDKLAEAYEEIRDKDGLPESQKGEGAFSDWAYFQYGRWSLTTRPWWIPTIEAEDEESEEDESEEEDDEEPEEDDRGADDLNALAWFAEQGVDGFVEWQPFDHPDLAGKKVEIGGFKPFLRANPPAEVLDELAAENYGFLLKLGDMLPRLKIAEAKAESLGSGLWRVTVAVENEGVLPTVSEMGRITRDPQRLQVELQLPTGVSLVTGHGRRRIGPLAGDGGRADETWLVYDESGKPPALNVRAWSPMAGNVVERVLLEK